MNNANPARSSSRTSPTVPVPTGRPARPGVSADQQVNSGAGVFYERVRRVPAALYVQVADDATDRWEATVADLARFGFVRRSGVVGALEDAIRGAGVEPRTNPYVRALAAAIDAAAKQGGQPFTALPAELAAELRASAEVTSITSVALAGDVVEGQTVLLDGAGWVVVLSVAKGKDDQADLTFRVVCSDKKERRIPVPAGSYLPVLDTTDLPPSI